MLEAMIGGAPDKSFAYLGSLSEAEFMAYGDLTTALGVVFPFAKAPGFKYFVFHRNGKRIVVPSHALGRTSFKIIYHKGMVYGDGSIGPNTSSELALATLTPTLQNTTLAVKNSSYVARLMKGLPGYTYNGLLDNPEFIPPTEWEDIYYNLYTGVSGVAIINDIVPASDRVARATIATLGRLWMLVQGANISSTVKRANGRGRLDTGTNTGYGMSQVVGNDNTYGIDLTSHDNSVWHPVFEQL